MTKHNRILGALTGAAIADAMGTPLESRPVYLIKEELGNGGFVYDYLDLPYDVPEPHAPKGTVSDDFAISYISCMEFVKNRGISRQAAIDALLEWKYNEKYAVYFACVGPTTKRGLAKLEGNYETTMYDTLPCDNRGVTNGGSMKSWVAGLFNPGNIEKAIDDAIVMCRPSHDNVIALAGACAVAAGTSVAMSAGATLSDIIDAGIYGAREGYNRAMWVAKKAAGASIEQRIRLAVEIGLKYTNDFEGCVNEMTDIIGTGLNANEAVPAAFGFLTAADGDVMQSIYLAINAGNDSDSTAIVAGAIAGAFKGIDCIPAEHLPFLSEVNDMDIAGLARDISEVIA